MRVAVSALGLVFCRCALSPWLLVAGAHTRSHSELVLQLEDAVGQCGVQVRVRNLLDAEVVEHLVVGSGLQALKLVDGDLAVVNRDKVDELLVLVNVDIELLDGGRVGIDIFLDSRLGLEETLEGCLAQSHLLELRLLVALLRLSLLLEHLLVAAARHGVHHRLHVKQLTAQHQPRLLEWVAPFFNVFGDCDGKVLGDWVREDALGAVAITVGIDRHVFEGHQVQVNLLVVLVRLVIVDRELAELLGLFL